MKEPMRYRKRQQEADAIFYNGENAEEIRKWLGEFDESEHEPDNWIVKNEGGAIFVIPFDIFQIVYEVIPD